MHVEQATLLPYYHSGISFQTGSVCADVSTEPKEAEPKSSTSRSRGACRTGLDHVDGVHLAGRVQRSRSSPDRRSGSHSPRARTRSPSISALPTNAAATAPTILCPMFCNYSSNAFGAVAFYSASPPAEPMKLRLLPTSSVSLSNGAKVLQPAEQPQTKKLKSKESKRIVRYVVRAVLRGVSRAVAACTQPEAAPVAAEALPLATAAPVSRSVTTQTKPRSPIIRQAALPDADDLSICSEECCVANEDTCEWAGNVRALRDSHVRLVLRQLQQLRDLERLNRTLLRAHVAAPPAPAADITAQAACVKSLLSGSGIKNNYP